MKDIVFFDLEVNENSKKIEKIGAIGRNNSRLFTEDKTDFINFVEKYKYIVGHNIINFDLVELEKNNNIKIDKKPIDTLLLSALFFPEKQTHKLGKEYKESSEDINDPLNDCFETKKLFQEIKGKFDNLDNDLKKIYYLLLGKDKNYQGFFSYLGYEIKEEIIDTEIISLIKKYFRNDFCDNKDINNFVNDYPVSLAYALAVIDKKESFVPSPWVSENFPMSISIIDYLKNKKCEKNCPYCNSNFDEKKYLYKFFHYNSFREFNGQKLQEEAVKSAIKGESVLAIFPTGGGKSLSFQLPALIAGENAGGLTVVISPLVALMKDQVDSFNTKQERSHVIMINSLLNIAERKKAFEYIENGSAHILYIAPEMLRNKTLFRKLSHRNIIRFVIDEAHCFSTWGHDFRVDYQFIGKFIKMLEKKLKKNIPVSCFTATAKKQVIDDIKTYFYEHLQINFTEHIFKGQRDNLNYHVKKVENKNRYQILRNLIKEKDVPTIVYVAKTKEAEKISQRLKADGITSVIYHGRMASDKKEKNQDKFISGKTNVIVATNAFGMGIDKGDITRIIHYNVSGSLENYIQEAGRAGRKSGSQADCYILYNENDLNIHFALLKLSKLTINEIKKVWMAIKRLTKRKNKITTTPREIAKESGIREDQNGDFHNKILAAVNELEYWDYLEREFNSPKVFANSLKSGNADEAIKLLKKSPSLSKDKESATRVIKKLFTIKYSGRTKKTPADVDLIATELGLEKKNVIDIVLGLKELGILEEDQDIESYLKNVSYKTIEKDLKSVLELEKIILEEIVKNEVINYRNIVTFFHDRKIKIDLKDVISMCNYLEHEKIIQKEKTIRKHEYEYKLSMDLEKIKALRKKIYDISFKIMEFICNKADEKKLENQTHITVVFSFKDIKDFYLENRTMMEINDDIEITYNDIYDTLYFLIRNNIIRIDSSFFVLNNEITIKKINKDANSQYKIPEYNKKLGKYYKNRIKQIHIVGEYVDLLLKDKNRAGLFVDDYFNLEFEDFLLKYFENRNEELNYSLTKSKYKELFKDLSPKQREIIEDNKSQYINVYAGPGSGKTRLLVHKLATLICLDDIKNHQIMMLTFSNSAAMEFKKRLKELIGARANYVKVSTFHSFAFEILGSQGCIEKSETVIKEATNKINEGRFDEGEISYEILLIDEAQDMNEDDYLFIKSLINRNKYMKVLAVGDSDQNIFSFRGSNSKYFEELNNENVKTYELVKNYRSPQNLVDFTNSFIKKLEGRIKKEPIIGMKKTPGILEITKYTKEKENLISPIVDDVKLKDLKGSIAILSLENENAINIYSQLSKNGIKSKLLKQDSGYILYNLLELRTFLDYFKENEEITNDMWNSNIKRLKEDFKNSINLKDSLFVLEEFKNHYNFITINDLREYLFSKKSSELVKIEENEIVISTMHQAKGREFDYVFIYDDIKILKDDKIRLLYVAMTRAKKGLFIHTPNDYFSEFRKVKENDMVYKELNEIFIPLGHKDVHLSSFKKNQDLIKTLFTKTILKPETKNSGNFHQVSLSYNNKTVVVISKSMKKVLKRSEQKGYKLEKGYISSLVYWKPKDEDDFKDEIIIVLPIIELRKEEKK